MALRIAALDDPAVLVLLAALGDEYEQRYGSTEEMSTTAVSEFAPPDGLFLILVDEAGNTIAGGGFRRHSAERCEIKRMWTAQGHRRSGLASMVLAALEDAARSAGYDGIVLETGPEQPEAHSLYAARGYTLTDNLGRYDVATAYEKLLTKRPR